MVSKLKWLALFHLVACSSTPSGHKGDYKQYLKSEMNVTAPTDEIRAGLTRIGYMAGGEYEFKLVPYTPSLIAAETKDLQKLRGFDDVDRKIIEQKRKIELTEGKICLEVELTVVRFKEASKLEDWQVELVTATQQAFPMRWRDEDLRKRPVQSFFTGLYGQEAKWHNQGVSCTNLDFDLSQGFHVRLKPKYVQWPFSDNTSVTWGLEELSFQQYRGY